MKKTIAVIMMLVMVFTTVIAFGESKMKPWSEYRNEQPGTIVDADILEYTTNGNGELIKEVIIYTYDDGHKIKMTCTEETTVVEEVQPGLWTRIKKWFTKVIDQVESKEVKVKTWVAEKKTM